MTKRAHEELLAEIHTLLAEDMLKRLRDGGLEAKDWTAIAKFLKDNNIEAVPPTDTARADDAFSNLVQAAQRQMQDIATNLN